MLKIWSQTGFEKLSKFGKKWSQNCVKIVSKGYATAVALPVGCIEQHCRSALAGTAGLALAVVPGWLRV
jgi:hypothetical protein